MWGPSVKVARDAAGAWTGAAQGFAKKSGVRPDDLQQAPKDPAGGDVYLFHVKKTAGRAAPEVLPGVIGGAAARARVPQAHELGRVDRRRQGRVPVRAARSAGWSPSSTARSCPSSSTRWTTARAASPSSRPERVTYGHRFLPRGKAGGPLKVRSFADLDKALAKAFVDPRPRGARRAHPRAARRPRRRDRGRPPRAGRGVAAPRRVPHDRVRQHPGRVPRLAGGGAGDGARPSPEVRSDA